MLEARKRQHPRYIRMRQGIGVPVLEAYAPVPDLFRQGGEVVVAEVGAGDGVAVGVVPLVGAAAGVELVVGMAVADREGREGEVEWEGGRDDGGSEGGWRWVVVEDCHFAVGVIVVVVFKVFKFF